MGKKGKYLAKKKKTPLLSKGSIKTGVFQLAYWFFVLLFLETVLHGQVFGTYSKQFAFVAGFSIVFAAVLALGGTFLKKTAQFIYMLVITLVLVILFESQVIYELIFGTLYSVSQTQMGGDAITSFWRETLSTILENLPVVLLFLLPLAVLIALRVFCKGLFGRSGAVPRILMAVLAAAAWMVTIWGIGQGGKGYFSDYYYYHANDVTTTQTAQRFGVLTAFRLELFGSRMEGKDFLAELPKETVNPEAARPTENSGEIQNPQETVPATTEPVVTEPVEYNIMEFDFDALNEKNQDETIRAVNDYVATLTGTNKNAYTGMLEDYNLIMICAESFATGAIHPELTPTLYRLSNEGIIFNNFYNAFPNNTTNGEYSFLVGLNPDGTRDKISSSFYASRNSYMPFTASMAFTEQLGVQPYGYHNNVGDYYARHSTHKNIGYKMKFKDAGIKLTANWPTSDYEMVQSTIDDYLGQEQFLAYYMTFSGHYKYSVTDNSMSRRHWDAVKDYEGYDDTTLAYLSCNIELDRAVAYLIQRLEEEGVADRTAIVLVGDHFPYGLTDAQYSSLVGYEIDDFSKYKSSLLFWVGGLEEPIVVDEYCCNVDILPTILNLWGLEFDSRMLAGTDVFSDGPHIAVRVDKSFYTDKLWLNANTGEIKYLVDESEIPPGYVDEMIRLIQNRLDMSANILNSAYYNFLFDKGDVVVNRDGWT